MLVIIGATIVTMGIFAFFGLPVLPVLVVGAFASCGMAYLFTKNKMLITLASGLGIVACSYFIATTMAKRLSPADLSSTWVGFATSPLLVYAASLLAIVIATVFGIWGVRGTIKEEGNE